jgi:agmatinase
MIKHIANMKPIKTAYEPFNSATALYHDYIHLIGFEFDGTACFRKGAAAGPNEIRNKSPHIETFSPYLNLETDNLNCVDLGNLLVGDTDNVEKNWQIATDYFFELIKNVDLKKNNIKFLVLGGEHSISYAPIVTYLNQYPELILIHLDAHADLRDSYEGYHFSHAAIIRRVLEHFGEQHSLIQYGIRSGTKEEYEWMRKNETLFVSQESFIDVIKAIHPSQPIYLTLDLDYFDPAYLPGTGTPEAGGEDFHSFIELVKILENKNFVGADVVELAPFIDPTENSAVFATKVVRELLLALN